MFAHMCICTHTNVPHTCTKEGRVSRYLGGAFKASELSPHSQGARLFTVSHTSFLQDSQLPTFSTTGSLQASIAWNPCCVLGVGCYHLKAFPIYSPRDGSCIPVSSVFPAFPWEQLASGCPLHLLRSTQHRTGALNEL